MIAYLNMTGDIDYLSNRYEMKRDGDESVSVDGECLWKDKV